MGMQNRLYMTILGGALLATVVSLTHSCDEATFRTQDREAAQPVVDDPQTPKEGDKPLDPTHVGRQTPNTPPGGSTPIAPIPQLPPNAPTVTPPTADGQAKQLHIQLTCDNGVTRASHREVTQAAAGQAVDVRISGEICTGLWAEPTTILFVNDASSSMGKHYDDNRQEILGSDPQINGSCGRLQSATTVLSQVRDLPTVQVGRLTFAGDILNPMTVSPISVQDFIGRHAHAPGFCSYVIQDLGYIGEPGALDAFRAGLLLSGIYAPATNYAAAFDSATALFMNGRVPYGMRKVVYFLSDGMPTVAPQNADPAQAGIASGQRLRSVPNLTVNGILLGAGGAQAESILQQVIGNPDRVRRADRASDLPAVISAFSEARVDPNSGRAILRDAGGALASLPLRGPLTSPRSKVWAYDTQTFRIAPGAAGMQSEHQVTIFAAETAQGGGASHAVQVSIVVTR